MAGKHQIYSSNKKTRTKANRCWRRAAKIYTGRRPTKGVDRYVATKKKPVITPKKLPDVMKCEAGYSLCDLLREAGIDTDE